ncbi:MAG: carbohydrate ABC transporter permease [Roseburia sp.]|nr:carbohydrate ABC transporter permease [Roseburia sp.]
MKNNRQKTKKTKLKSGWKPLNVLSKILIYAYALILIVPLMFAVITSFKTAEERVVDPIGLPESLQWSNYVIAWQEGSLLRATINSLIISGGGIILLMLNVILVSYCLNRIRDTKIGTALYMLILCTMFIPSVGSVTTVMLRRQLGLYNNYIGEILCSAVGITFGVFIVSGFLRTIPRDLEEAAMIDGARDGQIMFRVLVPVIKPALVTVGIFSFTGIWNACLGPMLTLRDEKLFTIPMALLLNFTGQFTVEYEKMFAGVIMTSIPIVIIYLKCQKSFTSALTGSVKG